MAVWQSIAVFVLLAVMMVGGPLHAQDKRMALLIGNQSYDTSVGALRNPHNDIALVGEALKRQGFELLPHVKDGTRLAILAAVRNFARRLQGAGPNAVGFVYYSGHGAAEKDTNVNYLIPVDARDPGSTMFWDASLKLDDILRLLDGARGAAKFIVFDACRNELQLPTKDTTKGLVPVSEQQGMLIAYASAPGKTASDRGTSSGPYAAALAAELGKPGLDHLNLFQNVKETVLATTGGVQQPWESNGLSRRIYLTGQPQAASAPAQLAPPMSEAAQAWTATQNSTSSAVLEAFAGQYPNTVFATMARARIEELRKSQVAALAPPPKSTSPPVVPQPTPAFTPGREFRDCPDCPEMVVVPAGSFTMGSPESENDRSLNEGPQRRVTIAQPFAVGKYEVTFSEWDACFADGGCRHKPDDEGWGRGKRPVINIFWNDANQYVAWLSKKTGQSYRLLTEAEWEYAARAGSMTRYTWGPDIDCGKASFDGGEKSNCSSKVGDKYRGSEMVGSFKANAFGLHDMHGNVYEWVEDCYADSYVKAPADGGKAPETNYCSRVLRGGSWSNDPQFLRAAFRAYDGTGHRNFTFGFRLARTLLPAP